VPKGSPIKTVADLKGKRVAYNKGSNVQYFLVELLQKNGLQYGDVQSIFLPPPDARAAFEKGAVDAWIIWDPFLAAAQKTLDAQLLADATGVVDNRGYYFTSREFATKNVDVPRSPFGRSTTSIPGPPKTRHRRPKSCRRCWVWKTSITELYLSRASYGTAPDDQRRSGRTTSDRRHFFELELIPKSSTCCTPHRWT